MPKTAALVIVPSLALLALAPTSPAAHTCPYLAEGTATKDGVAYQASLWWSGQQLGCGGAEGNWFELTISSDAGTVVAAERFLGASNENVAIPDGCVERVDPYVAVGATFEGFVLEGYQHINLCEGTVEMHYTGVYGPYVLDLSVWTGL